MLRLAKAFWDIALWRRTPAQLPASVFLLVLVAAVVAVLEVAGALLPPGPGGPHCRAGARLPWVCRSHGPGRCSASRATASDSCRPAVRCSASRPWRSSCSIRWARCSTCSAEKSPVAIPLGLLLFVGLIWYLLACANIWRSALDSGLALGAAVALGYLLLSILLEQQLLPDELDDARAHPRDLRHVHGRHRRHRQGRRTSRDRLGPQCLSAHERAARSARHRSHPGLCGRAAQPAARRGHRRQCPEPRRAR